MSEAASNGLQTSGTPILCENGPMAVISHL
jgi:hypothetical protein